MENDDIIKKITKNRDKDGNTRQTRIIEESNEDFELIESKRIHDKENKSYFQRLTIEGRDYLVRWSSNTKTRKEIKKKVVERDIEKFTPNLGKKRYYVEKIKSGDRKVWFIKYRSKAGRNKQLKILRQNMQDSYGVSFDDAQKITTISRKILTEIKYDFKAKDFKI